MSVNSILVMFSLGATFISFCFFVSKPESLIARVCLALSITIDIILGSRP